MRCLILCGVLLGLAFEANACSCIAGTIADHYGNADIVFRAKVQKVERVSVPEKLKGDGWLDPPGYSEPVLLRASFKLLDSYKGTPQELDAVFTHVAGATCGLPIKAGEHYVFFSDARGVVSLCGGNLHKAWTESWCDALDELEALRAESSDE